MKKSLIVMSLLLFSFASIFARLTVKASNVKGKVYYKRATKSKYRKLTKRVKLRVGNIIKTSRKSSCQINFPNSQIFIKQKTKFIISETTKKTKKKSKPSVLMFFGRIFCKAKKKQQSHLSVYSPTCVAGVRGTEFETIVGESGKTKITVSEGNIVANSSGKNLEIAQGKEVTSDFKDSSFSTQNIQPNFNTEKFLNSSKDDLIKNSSTILTSVEKKMKKLEETVKNIELEQAKNQQTRNNFKKEAINQNKQKNSGKARELMKKYHDLNTDNVILAKQIKHTALYARTLFEIIEKIEKSKKLQKSETESAEKAKELYFYMKKVAFPKKKADSSKPGCCLFGQK